MVPTYTEDYMRLSALARRAGVPINWIGASGVGKTEMLKQMVTAIAKKMAAETPPREFGLASLIASQTDALSLKGFGFPKRKPKHELDPISGKMVACKVVSGEIPGTTEFYPLGGLPFVGSNLPDNGILFLDEIGSGEDDFRAACLTMFSNYQIGDYKLKPGWWIVCAMNGRAVNAYEKDLAGPFKARLCHAYLVPSATGLLKYAKQSGWHKSAIAMLEKRGQAMMPATPQFEDMAVPRLPDGTTGNPSPRQWEFFSKLMTAADENADAFAVVRFQAMQGVLGLGMASEVATYLAMEGHCPTLEDIMGGTTVVPKEEWRHYLSLGFAMMGLPRQTDGRKCTAYLKLCLDAGVSRDLIRLGVTCLCQTYPDIWTHDWAKSFM